MTIRYDSFITRREDKLYVIVIKKDSEGEELSKWEFELEELKEVLK